MEKGTKTEEKPDPKQLQELLGSASPRTARANNPPPSAVANTSAAASAKARSGSLPFAKATANAMKNEDENEKLEKGKELLNELLEEDIDSLNFADLDMTNDDLEFNPDDVDRDIAAINKNPQIQKAMAGGIDLRDYSREIDNGLLEVERGTVIDYLKESSNIASLYSQMISSDRVLEQMENLLVKFQLDIGNVGMEIKKLQDQCWAHQVKLNNRKAVSKKVKKFVEEIAITDDMKKIIAQGEVNDLFLTYLNDFNKKIAFVEHHNNQTLASTLITSIHASANANDDGHSPTFGDRLQQQQSYILAIRDVMPQIELLKMRAVAKVRVYLSAQVAQLKQKEDLKERQKELLGMPGLYHFLFKHAPDVGREVTQSYHDLVSKLYFSFFRGLVNSVHKLQYEIANKNDLIGIDESKTRGMFTGKKTIKHKTSVFSLGIRQHLIEELEKPLDIPAWEKLIEQADQKQPYEFLFRVMLYFLLDAVGDEMIFNADFFLCDMDSELFNDIFGRVIQAYNQNISDFVVSTYDAIGILIMIVIIQRYKVMMSKRLVAGLDPFFESTYQMLTSRFFELFELNFQSVKNVVAKDFAASIDLKPHYITRRYAEFTVSLLYLSLISEDMGDLDFVKKLNQNLSRLREEMEKILLRLAEVKYKDWKTKTVFLMNNYDLILTVMAERNMQSVDSLQIQRLFDSKMNDYVDDEINQGFGRLIQFVKTYGGLVLDKDNDKETTSNEPTATPSSSSTPSAAPASNANAAPSSTSNNNNNTDASGVPLSPRTLIVTGQASNPHAAAAPKKDQIKELSPAEAADLEKKVATKEAEVDTLLKEFHINWKVELEKVNSNIMKQFSNFKTGTAVFQKIVEDLLYTYTLFIRLIKKYFKNLRKSRYFTPETEITYEMKKLFVRYD